MSTVNCANCGAENPTHVNFCKQCGSKLDGSEQAAGAHKTSVFEAAKGAPEAWSSTPMTSQQAMSAGQSLPRGEQKYTALRGIASLCRLLSWIFVGLAAVGALIGLAAMFADSFLAGLGAIVGAVIWGAVAYIFWQIIAESISVLLDIELNTRQTAVLLERQMRLEN